MDGQCIDHIVHLWKWFLIRFCQVTYDTSHEFPGSSCLVQLTIQLVPITLGNPFAHLGKNITPPSYICDENLNFDWFKRHVRTGEHSLSDLDIFRFDFMFVNPRDVHPMFCLNAQTDMRFLLQQPLYPEGRRCKTLVPGAVVIKNLVSVCTFK